VMNWAQLKVMTIWNLSTNPNQTRQVLPWRENEHRY
jgi:hypothetical protein